VGRYLMKPVAVSAVRFDGSPDAIREIAGLAGVMSVSENSVRVGERKTLPLAAGDWVVGAGVGPVQVLDDATFKRRYAQEPMYMDSPVDVLRRLTGGDEVSEEETEGRPKVGGREAACAYCSGGA